MKDKYDTHKGVCGFDIVSINDDTIRFMMQVLACKLLRKCRKDQVITGVIETTKKCVARVQMNWATFLVNQLLWIAGRHKINEKNSIMHGY